MRMLVAGDFVPAGRLAGLATTDPDKLFGAFAQTIRESNVSMLNLEAPLCEPLDAIEKTGPNLFADPESAAFLANAGFHLVTLSNNHVFDFGERGLEATMSALDRFGIAYVGAGKNLEQATEPYIAESGGTRIAVLSFAENEWSTTRDRSAGACPIDPVANYHAILEAKRQADHVVVICHGGHEMHTLPSPRMKQLYRFYVEAGASAVINHHTHCVSGFEVYQDAPIFYSLGNFLFDSPTLRTGIWTQGMAVELTCSETSLDYEVHLFDQCTDDALFRLCDPECRDQRLQDLDALNQIISDDERLQNSFREYAATQAKRYLRYLEPTQSRLILGAQNRRLIPSLLSKRQRRLLLNVIRCEAHRDLIIEMLEHDVGYSRR